MKKYWILCFLVISLIGLDMVSTYLVLQEPNTREKNEPLKSLIKEHGVVSGIVGFFVMMSISWIAITLVSIKTNEIIKYWMFGIYLIVSLITMYASLSAAIGNFLL